MENATKALMIAAAVIVVLLVIGLGIGVFNMANEQIDNAGDLNEYQVEQMYHTDKNGHKIHKPWFTMVEAKAIHDRKIKGINKDITVCDVYVALNAQYHDNINLYEKWFPQADEDELEAIIIESTIVDWFEDEDASSEKVWRYFRAV